MRKKIGILTFHHVTNYGAVLQCYALQTILKNQGYEPEVINYKPRRQEDNLYNFFRFRKFRNPESCKELTLQDTSINNQRGACRSSQHKRGVSRPRYRIRIERRFPTKICFFENTFRHFPAEIDSTINPQASMFCQ